MELTQEQIKKLANNLSKIGLENDKLGDDIKNIIKYIDLLNEVDTTGVKPTITLVDKDNDFRKDIEGKKEISREELLNCSKQKIIQNQITISNIM